MHVRRISFGYDNGRDVNLSCDMKNIKKQEGSKMAQTSAKCPSCGGVTELETGRERGFCRNCGSPVQVRDAAQRVKVEHSGSVSMSGVATDESLVERGYQLLESSNPSSAGANFAKALDINPKNWKAHSGMLDMKFKLGSSFANFANSNVFYFDDYANRKPLIEFEAKDILLDDIIDDSFGMERYRRCFFRPVREKPFIAWYNSRNESIYCFCGTIVLFYRNSDIRGYKNKYYAPIKNFCESGFRNIEDSIDRVLQYAPESEKVQLIKLRKRFVDYPRNKLTHILWSMEGKCPFCGGKMSGFIKKTCSQCGKS